MKRIKTNLPEYKNPEKDLRTYQTILRQVGMILALLIMIIAVKVDITRVEHEVVIIDEREEIFMEEIIHTRQAPTIPPPPRPPVPVAVPDHVIIDDVDIFIDAEIDLRIETYLPPPPPPAMPKTTEAEEEDDDDYFFVVVEQMPELIGGMESLQAQIRYPELARYAGIQGRVIVQFIVNEKGQVENPEVIRGIGGGCDEEALRVIKMAEFTPGLQRGRPVRVQYSMPITFRLRE